MYTTNVCKYYHLIEVSRKPLSDCACMVNTKPLDPAVLKKNCMHTVDRVLEPICHVQILYCPSILIYRVSDIITYFIVNFKYTYRELCKLV